MTPSLVIFDCDGVLVDSELIANRVFCARLNQLGLPLTLEDMFRDFVGRSMPQCEQHVAALLGRAPPAGFIDEVQQEMRAALAAQVTAVPGVPALLAGLAVPFCVASSGDKAKIRLTLGKTGLLPLFEGKIFSVMDVARPKPAPDIFLHAAAQMGAPAADCVVVEDTPTGVVAGIAAGMQVCGFAARTPAPRLWAAGAHQVFDDMRALAQWLGQGIPEAAGGAAV